LFNENSSLCLFGTGGSPGSTCADAPKPGEEMTPEEKEILLRLSSKAQRYQTADQTKKNANRPDQEALEKSLRYVQHGSSVNEEGESTDNDVLHTDIYAANLSLLRN
jgi:hypothetical protein